MWFLCFYLFRDTKYFSDNSLKLGQLCKKKKAGLKQAKTGRTWSKNLKWRHADLEWRLESGRIALKKWSQTIEVAAFIRKKTNLLKT